MNRQLWALFAASLSCGGMALAACSGDDTSGGTPSPDASADSPGTTGDSTPGTDGPAQGVDSSPPDAGHADVTTAPETGSDTGNGADADATASDAQACSLFDGALDPDAVAGGRQIVTQFRCFGCHQSTPVDAGGIVLSGNANGISDAAPIYPPNLTPDPATGLGCWTDPQIERAILDGFDDKDAALCVMPKFRGRFVEAGLDVDASVAELAAFLRSLNVVNHQVPMTVCPTPSEAGPPSDGGGEAQADGAAEAGGDAGDGAAE